MFKKQDLLFTWEFDTYSHHIADLQQKQMKHVNLLLI